MPDIFKSTPRKWVKIAWAIKTFTGTIGTALWLQDKPKIGFLILAIGAAADVLIQFFANDGNNSPQT